MRGIFQTAPVAIALALFVFVVLPAVAAIVDGIMAGGLS